MSNTPVTATAPRTARTRLVVLAAAAAALAPLSAGEAVSCASAFEPPSGQQQTLDVDIRAGAKSYAAGEDAVVNVIVRRAAGTGDLFFSDAQGVRDAGVSVYLRLGKERVLRTGTTGQYGRLTLKVPIPARWRGSVAATAYARYVLTDDGICSIGVSETGQTSEPRFTTVR